MQMTREKIYAVQQFLNANGFGPLVVDGFRGRSTNQAIVAFKVSRGLKARPFIGPITWGEMFPDVEDISGRGIIPTQTTKAGVLSKAAEAPDLPWLDEAHRKMGLHERKNNKTLWSWLKRWGGSVGDPAVIPWCGDFVESAIAMAMPDEPLPENPFLAANWAKWGAPVKPGKGCVLSFWRGKPTSWKGHVGFYWGEDDTAYHVLGGNQKNAVTIARIAKNRLRKNGARWPSTAPLPPRGPEVVRLSKSGKLSTNEA